MVRILLATSALCCFECGAKHLTVEQKDSGPGEVDARYVEVETTDSSTLPEMKGEYFGQPKPGPKVEPFALPLLASRHDHYISSITFSPDGTEAYWPIVDLRNNYSRWIVSSRMEKGIWTQPRMAAFSISGYDDDVPCLSPSGTKLLFISRRPLRKGDSAGKENIWGMDREGENWSDPIPLSEAVNSSYTIHQQMSLDQENNLYFGGEGAEGYGSLDIYLSRYSDGKYQKPKNLGPVINGPEGEYAPFTSPDGSYLIFTKNLESGWTLFITFKDGDESWTQPVDLKESIEGVEGLDLSCAFITRDGQNLIFFAETESKITPYWIDTNLIEMLRTKASKQSPQQPTTRREQ
jgi:Tol biopolymer transport system component